MNIEIEKNKYADHTEYALIERDDYGNVRRVETFLTWWGVRTAKARWLKDELEEAITKQNGEIS